MVTSIDGKVTGDFLNQSDNACEVYYQMNREYKSDGFICGRVTMESSFTNGYYPCLDDYQGIRDREDFIATKNASRYAISYDRYGKVGWKTSKIEDEDPGYDQTHIIEVLSEKVSDQYLAYLQSIGVSYIFAGKEDIDILLSLEKLNQLFGISCLLLEGGSIINHAFLKANAIDELSLVVASWIADGNDKSLFTDSNMSRFELLDFSSLNGVPILKYKKK